jgi:hypothetical protein
MKSRWLERNCPKCRGTMAVIVRPPTENPRFQAVNGRCIRCSHRLLWVVLRNKRHKTFHLLRRPRLTAVAAATARAPQR